MSIKVEKEHLYQQVLASVNANSDSFNFDLWARAVRRQLLAALHKKTTHVASHLVINGCDSGRADTRPITSDTCPDVIHLNTRGSTR